MNLKLEKIQNTEPQTALDILSILIFGFVSNFGFRASDFPLLILTLALVGRDFL